MKIQSEIKTLLIVALVAIVLTVVWILLLRGMTPASAPQQPQDMSTSLVWVEQEVIAGLLEKKSREHELEEFAKRELAERLQINDEDKILLFSIEETKWQDLSFGCPREGGEYAQVTNQGYKLVLSFENKDFIYHVGEGQMPFLCGKVEERNFKGFDEEVRAAKKKLEEIRKIDEDSISVHLVELLSSYGRGNQIRCPSSGGGRPISIFSIGTPAYQITLSYQDEYYIFVGERGIEPIFCSQVETTNSEFTYKVTVYWSSISTHGGSYSEDLDIRLHRYDPRMAVELSFFEGNERISGPAKLTEKDPWGCGIPTVLVKDLRFVKCYKPISKLNRGSIAQVKLLYPDGKEEILWTEPIVGYHLTE